MPKITFLPDGKVYQAEKGALIQTIAEQAGVTISYPCAGKGVCGKCLIKIEKGAVDFENNGKLPKELQDKGFVLACRAKVAESDAEIFVTEALVDELGQFSDSLSAIGLDEALFPKSDEIKPITMHKEISVALPEMLDGLGDYDRFIQAVKLELGAETVDLPLGILRKLPDELRQNDGKISIFYNATDNTNTFSNNIRIVDICQNNTKFNLGLAIDIGTTTVAIRLIDIERASVIDTITLYNAQIDRGEDVISRINYAKNPDRILEMKSLIISTINNGIDSLCEKNGNISHDNIYTVTISANTTMVQLFMGINPQFIRLEPYTPAVMGVPTYKASELGLKTNPNTPVWIAPNIGSYVGGDITAGLLCTDFALDTEEICIFIDIGTNGEIVLGNNDFLLSCACSAGPAFEGGGIDMGMRASQGAIEGIEIDRETCDCKVSVIGGGKAKGICGSGLISVVAELFEAGIIDQRGKIDRSGKYKNVVAESKNARFYITPQSENDAGVYITENDIDNFVRAKAAIFSACVTMLNSVELDFDSISKFYIAGGFGRYIDVEKAQILGLLPRLDADKFVYVGNSSLLGSQMALLSEKHRCKVKELANRITYVDLSTEAGYMDEYVAAMFLPHTNMRLFEKK